MNVRPALPLPGADFADEAIDLLALSDKERAWLQEGLDSLDRGEGIPHEQVMSELRARREARAPK